MTIALSSPVTGLAQTGLTTPTYTIVADNAPTSNGRQYAVSALGGTQPGVLVSSGSCPFTLTWFKQAVWKMLGKPNPVTGVINNVPRNVQKLITRKGVLPLAGQPYQTMLVETIVSIPAGADTADAANCRAALSAHFGALSQMSAGIGDTVVTNVM
jgi:hypothetical protein